MANGTEAFTEREVKALQQLQGRRGELNPRQQQALDELRTRASASTAVPLPFTQGGGRPPAEIRAEPSAAQAPAPPQIAAERGGLVGLAATGVLTGIEDVAQLFNDGLAAIGLPTDSELFKTQGGLTRFLQGAKTEPETPLENIFFESFKEAGATLLPLGLIAKGIRAPGVVSKALEAQQEFTLTAREISDANRLVQSRGLKDKTMAKANLALDAVRASPGRIITELRKIPTHKLIAVEEGLALSAGAGRGVVKELFPESGPGGQLIGELIGSFTPTVTLGLIRGALGKPAKFISKQIGLETTEEAKGVVGRKLDVDLQEGRLERSVDELEKIQEDIPGFAPPLGQITGDENALKIERALQDRNPGLFQSVRETNQEVVRNYFNAQAPEGKLTDTITRLEQQRRRRDALLDLGISRNQVKLSTLRKDVDSVTANTLLDSESRLQRADAIAAERLEVVRPRLSPMQQGIALDAAYSDELARFRSESVENFNRVDELNQGVEVPVTATKRALVEVDRTILPQVQLVERLPDRVREVINGLGRDFELMMRAQKGAADLQIRDASGTGTRVFTEQQGAGGTPEVRGLSRGTPQWFRDLTIGPSAMKREQVENNIRRLGAGELPGDDEAMKTVAAALRRDKEFRSTPFFHPAMDQLGANEELSVSFQVLRGFRSELKALLRETRSQNVAGSQDVRLKVLNDVLDGVETDLNRLSGDQDIGSTFPGVAEAYDTAIRQYRTGVERLKKGRADRVRQISSSQRPRADAEDLPKMFLENETSVDEFTLAMGGREDARAALRDAAQLDFFTKAVEPGPNGRVIAKAADRWVRDHEHVFKAFPELRNQFRLASLQAEQALKLQREFRAVERNPTRAAKLQNPELFDRLDAQDLRMSKVQGTVKRTRKQSDKLMASQLLGADSERVAQRIVISNNPAQQYDQVAKGLRGDERAIAGLNRAVFDAISDKASVRVGPLHGDAPLQFSYLRDLISSNEPLLQRILAPHSRENLKGVLAATEMLARERRVIGSAGSPTALKLEVQSMLAQWLSRSFAVVSGRTGIVYGVAERGVDWLRKSTILRTEAQRRAILEEAIFDPKVAMTLILASRGANKRLLNKRLRAHLVNMNLEPAEPEEEAANQ